MKADEATLLRELQRRSTPGDGVTPADVAGELGMHPKRCLTVCQGWWGKRWLALSEAQGASAFTRGRLTDAGLRTVAGDG